MKLVEQVIASRTANRNATDKTAFSILTLLVGELETKLKREGKSLTDAPDADVITMVKKLIKSNNEVISLSTEAQAKKFVTENEVLKIFLPVEMSYGEIEDALTECLFSNVGEAIKCIDAKYAGKYDKAVACKIAKDLL